MSSEAPDLEGMAVLVTRAAAQAAEFVDAIERHGGRAIVHPVIAIVPPEDEAPLLAAIQNVGTYDWVLLTSANAAQALLDRLEPGVRPRAIACVGASTARVCEKRGLAVDLVPGEFNADGLLEALLHRLGDHVAQACFLMPRAAEGRETLPAGLRARGAHVDVVSAYRTVPDVARREDLVRYLEAGDVDAITLASPTAAQFLHRLVEPTSALDLLVALPALCIGPATARRAEALGYRVAPLPERADVDGMVSALAKIRSHA